MTPEFTPRSSKAGADMPMTTIDFTVDPDGVAVVNINVPDRPVNVTTPNFFDDFEHAISRIANYPSIVGAIITSSKAGSFMAGGDLTNMGALFSSALLPNGQIDIDRLLVTCTRFSDLCRKLETCGKPTISAINGSALGGGLEICLSSHYRMVADDPKIKLGLPEVQVGLMPGAGGTQRLPRLIGLPKALPLLIDGTLLSPFEALNLGIIDAVVPAQNLLSKAKAWIMRSPVSQQPWDDRKFRFPGGTTQNNPSIMQLFVAGNARVKRKETGPTPAPRAIMSSLYEGSLLPIVDALTVESQYFCKLAMMSQTTSKIRTLFLEKPAAQKRARLIASTVEKPIRKIGILGAGMMGSGLAIACAMAGIEVVLVDRNSEIAAQAKSKLTAYLDKQISRGTLNPLTTKQWLSAILITDEYGHVGGADVIIEAVFEDRDLKSDVIKKVATIVGHGTVIASNTSTIPISDLARSCERPERFIGLHFFSPVEKMDMVETIRGRETSDETTAIAMKLVSILKKTPIIVSDSPGFYTSRCFETYLQESLLMIAEGVSPALVENVARFSGMPMAPLALIDTLSIDLAQSIAAQTKRAGEDSVDARAADDVRDRMLSLGRLGRKVKKGFYDYLDDGSIDSIWGGLASEFIACDDFTQPSADIVRDRLIYRQVVECVQCLEEDIIHSPADGDLGAVLGWGFLRGFGGPFSYLDCIGLPAASAKLQQLERAYGNRFQVPRLICDLAGSNSQFFSAGHAA
ncbi:MAG: 3-hydroxyacyl-CoA dehydrogenase [Sphingomonadaceae bacterium PASS1]|nr:MAG: 3-hydroxyacyl-CoA dehydrogenase [Sphingomonadaceae bacterium PASS1]